MIEYAERRGVRGVSQAVVVVVVVASTPAGSLSVDFFFLSDLGCGAGG